MGWKQSKKFPEACQQQLSSQMVDEPTSGHALLVLLLTNDKELVKGVIVVIWVAQAM